MVLKEGFANSIRPFFETMPSVSDCIAGCGLLTGSRVRDITSPLSYVPCERW